MDPSLLFDDDGTVYYTRHNGGEHGHAAQATLDVGTGQLSPLKKLWDGTGGVWPEGPHLYKINGKYYLMIAEGGTSYDHCVTIARSDSPWGPFESTRPIILTHRSLKDNPIQAPGMPIC
jgi:alpha-N-arabinofuranosidase